MSASYSEILNKFALISLCEYELVKTIKKKEIKNRNFVKIIIKVLVVQLLNTSDNVFVKSLRSHAAL